MKFEVTTELLVQMSAYFAHMGIHNEEYLSFMTNYANFPPSHMIVIDKWKMNIIFIPVTLQLSKIVKYTVALQEEKVYLSSDIGYCALFAWFTQYSKTSMENKHKTSQISNVTVKNIELKDYSLQHTHF